MLSTDDAVEIASVLYQRPVEAAEVEKIVSLSSFINRSEFRAFLINTDEFKANFPEAHYALVAAASERIVRANLAHHIAGITDEVQTYRSEKRATDYELIRLAEEVDKFLKRIDANDKRLLAIEQSLTEVSNELRIIE